MTRSRSEHRAAARPNAAGRPRGHRQLAALRCRSPRPFPRFWPARPAAHAAARRTPTPPARRGRGHRAETHREPAERADQHSGARHREARAAARLEPRRLREVLAEHLLLARPGPGRQRPARHLAHLHARRGQRRQREPLRLAAERRHLSRRAAGHHHRRHARRARLRHPAHRGSRRPAGHAVRREFRGGHGPHHHQQAGPDQVLGGLRRQANQVDARRHRLRGGGFVNIPLSSFAAIRLVGWDEHDAGYIDNVAGTNANACIINGVRTFPTWAGAGDNSRRRHHAPTSCRRRRRSARARSATPPTSRTTTTRSTPTAAAPRSSSTSATTGRSRRPSWGSRSIPTGFFGYDPAVGDLQVAHFGPEILRVTPSSRRRSPSRARSATSTSSMPARS